MDALFPPQLVAAKVKIHRVKHHGWDTSNLRMWQLEFTKTQGPKVLEKNPQIAGPKITGDLLRLAGFSSLCIVAAIRKIIGVELGELGERPFFFGDQSLLQHEIRKSVYRYTLMVFF